MTRDTRMHRLMQQPALSALLMLLAFFPASLLPTVASAATDIPPYKSFVTDLTGTLSQPQKSTLEEQLRQIHQQQIAEIAILLVPTTAEENIFQYSMRVAEKWEVGSRHKDDGVLLVIAKNDRTSQILVGYGLEGTLTDVVSSRILRDVMPPHFRRGDFAGGLNATVEAIVSVLKAGPGAVPVTTTSTDSSDIRNNIDVPPWFVFIMFGWLFVARILRMLVGKTVAGLSTAGVTLILGLLAGLPLLILLFAIFFVPMLVIGDNRGRSRRGGFGGGGFGGGGFGGGGGGRFGGGGASGRW